MSDNETEHQEKVEEKVEDVVEEVKDDLKDPDITLSHLKALEERLEARISMLTKDKNLDADEKAELKAQLEKVSAELEEFKKAQEERDKKRSDESTIVIPPKDLDPPTHKNPEVDVKPENETVSESSKHRRLRWW